MVKCIKIKKKLFFVFTIPLSLTLFIFMIIAFQNFGYKEIQHPDLLEITATMNGEFVDFTLSPPEHKNLQSATSFNYTITNENWYACSAPNVHYPCMGNSHEVFNFPNIQLELPRDTHIGVYDVYVRLQTSEKAQTFGQEISYGPAYEKSLVIGKCDQDNFRIVSKYMTSNNHYTSFFKLELNGEILESFYGRTLWKLMAEVIDPVYGRWYYKFDQEKKFGTWRILWQEDDVRSLYGSDVTSGATFSGKFKIEVFIQPSDEECIYSAKSTFQLPDFVIPSIDPSHAKVK